MNHYDPSSVEPKWQAAWAEKGAYAVDLKTAEKPYFTHVMFPYPSGDKLHIGHWFNYAPADSFARFKKMQGYDVFSPIGFDAFGLPAENYAVKTGVHPTQSISANVETMIEQLKRIGVMYDWNRMVNTSRPEYYQWTQWLFLQMFKKDLAYRKEATVNYCDSCKTVLANEQVHDGHCDRCDSEVIQKPLTQWFWKITDYAQQLLDNLDGLDWPEKTKTMQRNWIGRSEGCDVAWQVDGHDLVLETYTTTVDTLFGVTFAVISPEHPELENITTGEHKEVVEQYCKAAAKQTEIDRLAEGKEKTGVPTGAFLVHPFTGEKVPLWVADYVLMTYGTGVVMGVPAHDQRDLDFANKFDIPVVQVIENDAGESFVYDDVDKKTVKGTIVKGGDFTDMTVLDGRQAITEALEKNNQGRAKVQYRLRDWLLSRQRYWGAPIPIVYDPDGKAHPIPEEHLPWTLPEDVDFTPDGTSPLARSAELKERTEKIFGEGWTPEVDTMDTFVCSSFYTLMYLAADWSSGEYKQLPVTNDIIADKDIEKKWLPVDMYIGGAEHATMHLIYARFVSMVLKDMGHISHAEQYQRLVHQGIITNGGAKMSKSKGNVVSPDEFVEQYGSDVFRMYLMFMGPFTDGGDWSDTGIKGIDRFVQRVWRLLEKEPVEADKDMLAKLHFTVKKVGEDIEKLHFNTAISALMELLNVAEKTGLDAESAKTFITLLAPLAPHLAEELWEKVGGDGLVVHQVWPTYDESLLVADTMTIAVQVNGKVRGQIEIATGTSEADVLAAAKAEPSVAKYVEGEPKKEIYIEGKLVSLVV